MPSKARILDLLITVFFTSLKCTPEYQAIFFICANYNKFNIFILKIILFKKALIINEREESCKSMIEAYNIAFKKAKNNRAEYVILWADDVIPEKSDWLCQLIDIIKNQNLEFGIFSSDEGHHKGYYGWNIFGGYPCAHFFIAKTNLFQDKLMNPKFFAYTADNEIAINMVTKNIPISLIPVRIIHQHTSNKTRRINLKKLSDDLQTLYSIYPHISGMLDNVVLHGIVSDINSRFIADKNKLYVYNSKLPIIKIDEFILQAFKFKKMPYKILYEIRKYYNEKLLV